MNTVRITLAGLLLAGAWGCGGGARPADRTGPPPPRPVQAMAIDEDLRERARGELHRGLASDEPAHRAHALEAIAQTLGEREADAIVQALADEEPLVVFAACMAAGDLRLDAARAALMDRADDPDPHVRVGVRYALHRLGDKRLSRDLEQTAQHPDPGVRANTALVLGRLEEPSAIRILRVLRRDPSVGVRLQSFEAMWELDDDDGLESLIAATLSAYPDDQMVALLALAAPRDRSVAQHVRTRLTTDYVQVNLVAARAMGMLGSDEGYEIALAETRSEDAGRRMLAALALGAIGRADSQPALARLLEDRDPTVRLASASAILQLGVRPGLLGEPGSLQSRAVQERR